ncbi:response regulator [Candidatus Rickettsiella viridis]|uniref:response regulator n=1 Tax=Candidatus Rickettsiella viridis TaxID=676208 RepID=UPI001E4E6A3A|nr:response regulator [Candidatus Rickettsiella viridis]
MQQMYKKNKNLKKILLVDDDLLALRVMSQYLEDAGYSCVMAKDGQQAWDFLQQSPDEFFVVFADRVMPKLHGLELLAKMKRTLLRDIPVVLLTGEASHEERCDALRQGVYDFFYKPISKPLLLAIVKKIQKFKDSL